MAHGASWGYCATAGMSLQQTCRCRSQKRQHSMLEYIDKQVFAALHNIGSTMTTHHSGVVDGVRWHILLR
jgi:hypothetical protein